MAWDTHHDRRVAFSKRCESRETSDREAPFMSFYAALHREYSALLDGRSMRARCARVC